MTTLRPGFACCPSCGKRVLFALARSGDVLAFDAAFEDGPWAIRWDPTSTPRCRMAGPSGRAADDEYRYAEHAETCGLAEVIPLAERRPLPPAEPEWRHASAR